MSNDYIKVIIELVAEKGSRRDGVYLATFSSTEVLEALGHPVTPRTHSYVRKAIELHFPTSSFEPIGFNGKDGWLLHMRVRSK
jgi:hypothetical protein